MFYGHLDTVPLYGEWDSDPYRLTARDDRLFGLGAADMKGGMFAILEAAKRLELPKGRKIKIALCVDEENESIGAYALSADPFLQDVQLIIAAEIGDARPEKEGAKTISLGRRDEWASRFRSPGSARTARCRNRASTRLRRPSLVCRPLKRCRCLSTRNWAKVISLCRRSSPKAGPCLCRIVATS